MKTPEVFIIVRGGVVVEVKANQLVKVNLLSYDDKEVQEDLGNLELLSENLIDRKSVV